MPELPDISAYITALDQRIVGQPLESLRIVSPSLLKTARPPVRSTEGRKVERLRRIGKRIAFGFEGDLWLVLHLMIAGRLHWREKGAKLARKIAHAGFDFPDGTLVLTEFGPKKRASLHVVGDKAGLAEHDPGGLEVLDADPDAFRAALTSENHTLKRALTDPRQFSGIGNAYSDEILLAAKLSPLAMTRKLTEEEIERLFQATQTTLTEWIDRLGAEAREKFPEKVTAFRPEMAAHGKYQEPCPVCETPIQRIRYADNETNYCPRCQTGGKVLADRSLSRLLGKDWPRTIEELEQLRKPARADPLASQEALSGHRVDVFVSVAISDETHMELVCWREVRCHVGSGGPVHRGSPGRGGLKGTDIANITEVSKATVSRWAKGGATPHPRAQLILSDLHYIVNRLEEYYSAEEIRTWLYARHPQLDGVRAIDLINEGRSEEILRILDRLDAGVYL